MRFFYCSFNQYRKLSKTDKDNVLFLSTAFSSPNYFTGKQFYPFVPSQELHLDALYDFANCNFFERYKKQIESLDHSLILKYLKGYECEIIVFLFWEDESKKSERDILIPWLTKTSINDIYSFSFINFLQHKKIIENSNIFDI
jgi:hypothetical protein